MIADRCVCSDPVGLIAMSRPDQNSREQRTEPAPGNKIVLPAPERGPQERLAIAPRLLRVKNAAEYLSLGVKQLRSLIASGELPHVQLGKNSPFLVDRCDLDKFIERHKVGASG
jgi:excisionase family DNA binding protein